MSAPDPRELERRAIDAASEAVGLQSWYRACVLPLLHLHEDRFPSCCGGGCEPCNDVLCEVARRARRALGIDETGALVLAASPASEDERPPPESAAPLTRP